MAIHIYLHGGRNQGKTVDRKAKDKISQAKDSMTPEEKKNRIGILLTKLKIARSGKKLPPLRETTPILEELKALGYNGSIGDSRNYGPAEINRLKNSIKELEGDIRRLRPSDPMVAKLKSEIAEIEKEIKENSTKDAATPGKKYHSLKGIVTYIGPDKEGRHGDIIVKNASGFTIRGLTVHSLGEEFKPKTSS